MEVNFVPELEAKLNELAAMTGRGADELVQDVIAGYIGELGELRGVLDERYEDLRSGRIQPMDGDEARALLKAKTETQRHRRA